MDQQTTANSQLELSPEDLKKINAARAKAEGEVKSDVDPEWAALAEFGTYYGWAGLMAALNNEIDTKTFSVLLQAGRKVWYGQVADTAQAHFIGSVAAQSTKPVQNFGKLIKGILKLAKVSK